MRTLVVSAGLAGFVAWRALDSALDLPALLAPLHPRELGQALSLPLDERVRAVLTHKRTDLFTSATGLVAWSLHLTLERRIPPAGRLYVLVPAGEPRGHNLCERLGVLLAPRMLLEVSGADPGWQPSDPSPGRDDFVLAVPPQPGAWRKRAVRIEASTDYALWQLQE